MERRKDLEETLELLFNVLTSSRFRTDFDQKTGDIYRNFYEVIEMNEDYLKDASNPWTSEALNKIVRIQKRFIGCTPLSILLTQSCRRLSQELSDWSPTQSRRRCSVRSRGPGGLLRRMLLETIMTVSAILEGHQATSSTEHLISS